MSEAAQDFWQSHSDNYLQMALSYERREQLQNPDGYGRKTGDCGDTVEFFLRFEQDKLKYVNFDIHGCLNTNACANTVAFMCEGKTLDQAWEISPEQVADYLQTLPEDHFHCAELAVGAFYLALGSVGRADKK